MLSPTLGHPVALGMVRAGRSRAFPAGRSALCAFVHLHTLLVKTSEAPVFQLTIQRAAQRHFEDWLTAVWRS